LQFVISSTFTRSLEQLDKSAQDQIKKAVFDFQVTPDTPGSKLHRVDKSKDKDFWSIRVSDDLRIILHKRDDLFTFCYVDHHDEAYAWAERRRFTIHPQTGAAQIVEIVERVEEVVKQVQKEGEPALFSNYEPNYLLSLGVPQEWLAAVRNIGESGLWKLKEHLPEEAFERLFALAAGDPVPTPEATPKGQNPLTHPDAQRRFKVLDNQNELRQALDYPWERWLVFLHPAQKTIVEKKYQGPALVSGSAGTGKTVCALHRAAFLVRKNPGHKVLLTTFSRTLAARLSQSAELLQLTNEERKRLQIKHLHSIARELYTERARKSFSPLRQDEANKLLEEGARTNNTTLSQGFLRAEWEAIVDARGITTWAVYKSTSRAGRGTAISVKQRQEAWKVFEHVYQKANLRSQMTWSRLCYEVMAQLGDEKPYQHIITDESQDFGPSELKLLRALVPAGADDIFLAGDAGQRIYRMPFSWASAGIDVRGRSSRLKINYRTTEQIRSFSDGLMPESVEEASGTKESRATVSVLDGPRPELKGFATAKEEAKGVASWLEALRKEGYQPRDIAIFTRTEDLLKDRAENALKLLGVSGHYLSDDQPPSAKDIALGSMHRAKGLEFRVVVVMGCEQNKVPLPFALREQEDDADKEAFLAQERQLLYVACTRARERLLITYTGSASRFLVPAEPTENFPKTGAELPPDADFGAAQANEPTSAPGNLTQAELGTQARGFIFRANL
jgi:mRNA-degrading endonuclease RelE of RelBE toxin-antitoxin system